MPGPEVTVTGGPAGPSPGRAPRGGGVLGAVAVLAVVAGGLAVGQAAPAPPPPPPVDASLTVLGDRIATSQAGVLVVPVAIDNRGPAVAVEGVVVRAGPVRQDPASNGVRRVGAGQRRGFAAIVQPDCAVLQPATGIGFVATAAVRLRTDTGVRAELVVDLATDPAVASRVAALCG